LIKSKVYSTINGLFFFFLEKITPTKVSEDSIWVEVKTDDQFVGEDVFDSLTQQFSSDPKARIQKEVSNTSEKVPTMKKTKELKVLDPKAAQNLSEFFVNLNQD